MERLSHIISTHIFIFATSIAMLVHSTWTFGTLFSGQQPTVYINDPSTILAYVFWVTPALLVALAIDVGQIQTSVKLSKSKTRRQQVTLGITFVTLALAGYYLQWFHLAHHIPALEFGAGLTADMRNSLEGFKSLAIFIIPALLPLSTILYTLSNTSDDVTANMTQTVNVNYPSLPIQNAVTPAIEKTTDEEDTQEVKTVDMTSVVTANDDDPNAVTSHNSRTCEECGQVMVNPTWNQRFCNDACRQSNWRKRQSEEALRL